MYRRTTRWLDRLVAVDSLGMWVCVDAGSALLESLPHIRHVGTPHTSGRRYSADEPDATVIE